MACMIGGDSGMTGPRDPVGKTVALPEAGGRKVMGGPPLPR